MTKEIRMPNDARMPDDDCRKRASKASRECMHLAIRASDFVIFSSLGISSFVMYVGRGA
jgi:hypothetical protein